MTLLDNNWSDIYSKFYTQAGFEPTIQLGVGEVRQNIWNPRHKVLATSASHTTQQPRPNEWTVC